MEYNKIEGYVTDLLEISGIGHEDKEQPLRLTLYHMLMCVKLYEGLDEATRGIVAKWRKHFQYLIAIKFNLKERKGRKEKKNSPSYSPNKEKAEEAKGEKTTHTVCDADSGFDEDLLMRYEVFKKKCEKYVGKYGREMIDNFVRYWTLPNQATGKMQFEEKTYWCLKPMLESWSSKSYTKKDAVAAMSLKKAQQKKQKTSDDEARSRQLAAEREEANAELERQRAESKAGAVSYEEWLASKKTTDGTD
jgi:hypothetical protein